MVVGILLLVAVAIGVVVAVTQSDRYRPRVRTEFTMPTTEIHIDPVTGKRQRVYVNPGTGERAFVDEPVALHGGPPPGPAGYGIAAPGATSPPPSPPGGPQQG